MNRQAQLTLNRPPTVDGLANYVEDAAQNINGSGYGTARIHGLHAPEHTVGGRQGNAAYRVMPQMLSHLHDNVNPTLTILMFDPDSVIEIGQISRREPHIDHGSRHLYHSARQSTVQPHRCPPLYPLNHLSTSSAKALAPPTISLISAVMPD